jgi:hypothetical protein
MEATGKIREKSLTVEGDALKSGGSGTDEFLNREKWHGCEEVWRRKGEKVH